MVEMMATGCHSVAKATVTESAIGPQQHYYSNHTHHRWLDLADMVSLHHQTLTLLVALDWTMKSAADVPTSQADSLKTDLAWHMSQRTGS